MSLFLSGGKNIKILNIKIRLGVLGVIRPVARFRTTMAIRLEVEVKGNMAAWGRAAEYTEVNSIVVKVYGFTLN